MLLSRRRAIVAGTVALAGGTVAAAAAIRKPGPFVHTPVADPEVIKVVSLQDVSTLQEAGTPQLVLPFGFTDGSGKARKITEYAGRGVVVNFWATWCPPCVAELPALAKLAGMVHAEGIDVLALSVDRGGADKVRAYFQTNGITGLDILVDPQSAASHALGCRGVPTTIIVDRSGRERARMEGPADWASDDMVQAVRRYTKA